MTRSILLVVLISAFAAPVQAKGGGSDIQHEREKLQAAREKAGGKSQSSSPSVFELIFGGNKSSNQGAK